MRLQLPQLLRGSIIAHLVRDREAWHAAVHGTSESDTTWQLNNNNETYSLGFPVATVVKNLPAKVGEEI